MVADFLEDARREDVAARHAHAGWRLLGAGFFHDFFNADELFACGFARHDAVAFDVFQRHFLHCQNGAALLGMRRHHLAEHRRATLQAHHQVIGQQDSKRLVAHHGFSAQHRMAQTERAGLAHIGADHVVGLDRAHQGQQLVLVGRFEFVLEFVSGVEMVFDGPLAAARDKDHVAHARAVGFFHRVLDQGFVDHRQHLFGRGFGGGQKAGAQACHREDGFANDVLAHGVSDGQG